MSSLPDTLRPQCEQIAARYEQKRSALLPIMHLFQEHEGYVSDTAMRFASEFLDVPLANVESTVSFYTLFFRKPVGKYVLQVCRGLMCELRDSEEIRAYIRGRLGVGHLETTGDGIFSYEEVECLAACDRATCMQINLEFVYDLSREKIDHMLEQMRAGTYPTQPLAQTAKPERTWRVGQDGEVGTGGKSSGTMTATNPNDAGGLGDATGVIMLDRFVTKEVAFTGRSRERSVRDAQLLADLMEDEKGGPGGSADGGRGAEGGAPFKDTGSPNDARHLGDDHAGH
jgi:NADH-quinone oxidoreductase subunit E